MNTDDQQFLAQLIGYDSYYCVFFGGGTCENEDVSPSGGEVRAKHCAACSARAEFNPAIDDWAFIMIMERLSFDEHIEMNDKLADLWTKRPLNTSCRAWARKNKIKLIDVVIELKRQEN